MTPSKRKALTLTFLIFSVVAGLYQNCSPQFQSVPLSAAEVVPEDIEQLPTAKPKLIVALGDSLTRGANPKNPANTGVKGYVPFLQEELGAGYEILNCGIGGQTTAQIRERLEQIVLGDYQNCSLDVAETSNTAAFYDFSKYQGQVPDTVLLLAGTNDLLQGISLQTTQENLEAMISLVLNANMKLYLGTVPPLPAQMVSGQSVQRELQLNSLVQEIVLEAANDRLILADLYPDLQAQWAAFNWDGIHLNQSGNEVMARAWLKAFHED